MTGESNHRNFKRGTVQLFQSMVIIITRYYHICMYVRILPTYLEHLLIVN